MSDSIAMLGHNVNFKSMIVVEKEWNADQADLADFRGWEIKIGIP